MVKQSPSRLKFGLYHVDFESPSRDRKKKASVDVYKKIVKKRSIKDGKNQITRHYCDEKETKNAAKHQAMHDEQL